VSTMSKPDFEAAMTEAFEARKAKNGGILTAEEEKFFRDIIHTERMWKAKRKLHSPALDQSSVLSTQGGVTELFPHGMPDDPDELPEELTVDELMRLSNLRVRLEDDILILLEVLVDSSSDNIDALWRVVEAAGLIGRLMGEHPLQAKLRTAKAKKERLRLAKENDDRWVLAFNKAIKQAHASGLEAKDAIQQACKALHKAGVKIPVKDEALRSRERELRTGKKRK
jgi:hypothetical protein